MNLYVYTCSPTITVLGKGEFERHFSILSFNYLYVEVRFLFQF